MSKYDKKIKKSKEKKYKYSEKENLGKTLGLLGAHNHPISNVEIDTLIKNLRYQESIGEIEGLVIKDMPNYLYIMWDDDSLGAPLLIRKSDLLLNTSKKLVEYLKKAEQISILDIYKDLENPLIVYYITMKKINDTRFSYLFLGKNDGKAYILEGKKNIPFFDDIKTNILVSIDHNSKEDVLEIKPIIKG